MISLEQTVLVVEDDPECREAMVSLLKHRGKLVKDYGSAEEFTLEYDPANPGCLVLNGFA